MAIGGGRDRLRQHPLPGDNDQQLLCAHHGGARLRHHLRVHEVARQGPLGGGVGGDVFRESVFPESVLKFRESAAPAARRGLRDGGHHAEEGRHGARVHLRRGAGFGGGGGGQKAGVRYESYLSKGKEQYSGV